MKKLPGAIVLILILIFHFSGGNLLFHIQRQRIRKEIKTRIKQGVPKSEMRVFTFSLKGGDLKNLQWHEDHEFRYEGHMYDIVHRKTVGDSITFYCINDDQETTLFAHLDELTQKKSASGPARKNNELISQGLSLFYLTGHEIHLPPCITFFKQITNPYIFPESAWKLVTDTPPPRFASSLLV